MELKKAVKRVGAAAAVGVALGVAQHLGGDPGMSDALQEATRAANPDLLKAAMNTGTLFAGGQALIETGRAIGRHSALNETQFGKK